MNLIKTPKRTQLGGDVDFDLVFLSFNLGCLHETDAKLLVKSWKESGHKLLINKNDTDSIVLGHLRSRDSHGHRFFLKEAYPYKPTDFRFLKKKRANPTESRPHAPPLRRVARPSRPPGAQPGP